MRQNDTQVEKIIPIKTKWSNFAAKTHLPLEIPNVLPQLNASQPHLPTDVTDNQIKIEKMTSECIPQHEESDHGVGSVSKRK